VQYEKVVLGDGLEMHYCDSFVRPADAAHYLFLRAEKMSFSDEVVTMYSTASVIRRRTVDYGLKYSYNATSKASIPWEEPALALRGTLEKYFRLEWQQCACNEFRDEESYIGPHVDKTTLLGDEKREPLYIASISLGSVRRMVTSPPGASLKGMRPYVDWFIENVPGTVVKPLAAGSLIRKSSPIRAIKPKRQRRSC